MNSLFWIGLSINGLEYMYNYLQESPYIHLSLIGSVLMITGIISFSYNKLFLKERQGVKE